MTSDQVDRTVQLAVDDAARPSTRRTIVAFAAVSVVLAAAAIVMVLWWRSDSRDLEAALRSDSSTLRGDVVALRDQVRGLGGTPVVPERGAPGSDGLPGSNGRDGADGRDGKDGASPPCLTESAQCRGADGSDGADGSNGADGADGQPGKDGAAGTDGVNGTNGVNGRDGAPGPACPEGYELRDAVITADDGSTYRGKACVNPASSTAPSPEPTGLPTLRSGP